MRYLAVTRTSVMFSRLHCFLLAPLDLQHSGLDFNMRLFLLKKMLQTLRAGGWQPQAHSSGGRGAFAGGLGIGRRTGACAAPARPCV